MAVSKKTPARKAPRKQPARKQTARKSANSRKRLEPRREPRGIAGAEVLLEPGHPLRVELERDVTRAGGTPIGAYCEPLSGNPLVLAVLPRQAVEPTPFQRDLSPTHTKRLAARIEESGSFLDPLIVVRSPDGKFWTPNGRHRLAAAKVLGLRSVTALISADEELAFRILALNTEKAHNLKDRSLEVIRMARELATRSTRTRESDYAEQFEEPALLTLGTVYESQKRFAGSAYFPMLRRVDRFNEKGTLRKSLEQRAGWGARLLQIDERVKQLVGELKERGFRSPYLRNFVVARINPVRFVRAGRGETRPSLPIGSALTKMTAGARNFDVDSVRQQDLALVAALSSGE